MVAIPPQENTYVESSQTFKHDVTIPRASFHTIEADEVGVFYREAGPASAPVVFLFHGFPSSSAPESYTLDAALLERPGMQEIQLDLFLNYASNLALYPVFQKYFREAKPPLLAIWGKHDPFFIPPGAEAYRRDNPNTIVEFLDTGHFALETHVEEIAEAIHGLLARVTRST